MIEILIEILDKTFRYDTRIEQPKSFKKFFYSLTRRYDQTLMSYCAKHREALREVEKHGIKLPTEITGWLMLRRSDLSQDQKYLVQSQCGSSLEESKVEKPCIIYTARTHAHPLPNTVQGFYIRASLPQQSLPPRY